MQAFQIDQIPLSAIDVADKGFRITRADDDVSALAASMTGAGLLVPPLVLARDQGFVPVSGFRRLAAAASLDWESIACRIAASTSEKTLAKQAVAENAFQRELSPGEQVRAAGLLGRHMDAREIADASLAIFNTRLNPGFITHLIRIHSLPHPAIDLLEAGNLSIKAAKTLTGFDTSTAAAFLSLFSKVRVSSSKQMEIMTWAREISVREKLPVADLCAGKEIAALLETGGPTAKNAGHKDLAAAGNLLRAYLFQRRFPALDQAKKSAAGYLQTLKLPRGVTMTLPEHFESMMYSLSMNFKTPEELQTQLKALAELPGQEEFASLVNR
ncbi:MAG: ParB/RepB/Spo0J family partition protein [Desulfobacter sp.]